MTGRVGAPLVGAWPEVKSYATRHTSEALSDTFSRLGTVSTSYKHMFADR
jgi:hypothetical protein